MSEKRFFSYDIDCDGFEFHETLEEARDTMLNACRDLNEAINPEDDGYDDADCSKIVYGEVKGGVCITDNAFVVYKAKQ